MKKRIYKYPLRVMDEQYIPLPPSAQILTVDVQYGNLVLWALVDIDDPEMDSGRRLIYVIGTGNMIQDDIENMSYVNTVQMRDGNLVWHVFAEIA